MLALNDEEKNVLRIIESASKEKGKIDYYGLVEKLDIAGDTSVVIPVVGRLEDDGYIKSNGLIYRYLWLTDKGRKALA